MVGLANVGEGARAFVGVEQAFPDRWSQPLTQGHTTRNDAGKDRTGDKTVKELLAKFACRQTGADTDAYGKGREVGGGQNPSAAKVDLPNGKLEQGDACGNEAYQRNSRPDDLLRIRDCGSRQQHECSSRQDLLAKTWPRYEMAREQPRPSETQEPKDQPEGKLVDALIFAYCHGDASHGPRSRQLAGGRKWRIRCSVYPCSCQHERLAAEGFAKGKGRRIATPPSSR